MKVYALMFNDINEDGVSLYSIYASQEAATKVMDAEMEGLSEDYSIDRPGHWYEPSAVVIDQADLRSRGRSDDGEGVDVQFWIEEHEVK